jgi:hypothetical protein
VTPSHFKSDCRINAGDTLADFSRVDYFALQFPSDETSHLFRYCLSAINLQ